MFQALPWFYPLNALIFQRKLVIAVFIFHYTSNGHYAPSRPLVRSEIRIFLEKFAFSYGDFQSW